MTPVAAQHPSPQVSTGTALIAALAPLFAWPLSLLALGVAAHAEERTAASLAEAWNEGGVGMYAISAMGALATLASAGLLFLGVRRGSAAVLAIAPLCALVATAGALVTWLDARQVTEAVLNASPADRATIVAGSIGESLWCNIYGLIAAAALLTSAALGTALGALVARSRLLFVAALTFAVLALVHAVGDARLVAITRVFRTLAMVNPANRVAVMVAASDEVGLYRVPQLGALALLAVVMVLGVRVLAQSSRAGVLLGLCGLAGLAGVGSVTGFTRLTAASQTTAFTGLAPPVTLVPLQGYAAREPSLVLDAQGVRAGGELLSAAALAQTLEDAEQRRAGNFVEVGLAPTARAASLWALLGTAGHAQQLDGVGLVGSFEEETHGLTPELSVVVALMQHAHRQVPVGVALAAERCEAPCVFATATAEGLTVDGQTWKPGPVQGELGDLVDDVLLPADPRLEPAQVVLLSTAAAARGRRLVFVFDSKNN